jgi:hypothetical protein
MIGQLITAGKLKESDTFVSILPEYKVGTDFDKITIKDLLDMNSGLGVSDNYPTGPSGWGVGNCTTLCIDNIPLVVTPNRKCGKTWHQAGIALA